MNPQNLNQFYSQAGQKLPSIQDRAKDPNFVGALQKAGFTPDQYLGMGGNNANANIAVLPFLLGGAQGDKPPIPTQTDPNNPVIPEKKPSEMTGNEALDAKAKAGQQFIDQSEKSYNDLKTTLTDLQTGTLQLNPEEKQYVDSMHAAADRAREISKLAYESYTGVTKEALARSGANRTSPQQAAAQIALTVQAGASALLDIDTKANNAIAEFQKGIREGRIKDARDAYNDFKGAQKDRYDTLKTMYDDVTAHEKDLRDYKMQVDKFELDKQKFALDAQKTRAEIAKLNREAGVGIPQLGNEGFGKDIRTSLAGIRFPSVTDRKVAEDSIASLLADGDIQGARNQLRQYAFNGMDTETQRVLAGKDNAIQALDRIQTGLDQLDAAGVSTGFFTGLKQRTLEKGGLEVPGHPELNEIANDIALSIIDYRKAVSGAAFTESEAKSYDRVFPSTGKTAELNKTKINSLKTKFDADIQNAYSKRITKYKEVEDSLKSYQENPAGIESTSEGGNTNDPLGIN